MARFLRKKRVSKRQWHEGGKSGYETKRMVLWVDGVDTRFRLAENKPSAKKEFSLNWALSKRQFMKRKLKLFQAPMFCAATLGIGSSFSLVAAAQDLADHVP